MRFSLPSVKCSAAPPSRVCCLNYTQRFDLITARSALLRSWEELPNIWLTVVKNAFVCWALNLRVRMLLKDAVTPDCSRIKLIEVITRGEFVRLSDLSHFKGDLHACKRRSISATLGWPQRKISSFQTWFQFEEFMIETYPTRYTQNFCAYRKIIYTGSRKLRRSFVCFSILRLFLRNLLPYENRKWWYHSFWSTTWSGALYHPFLMQQLSVRTPGNALAAKGTTIWPASAPFEHNQR